MKIKKIFATLLTATMLTSVSMNFLPAMNYIVEAATYPEYSGNDLGCTYTKSKSTFKVWAPTASKVVLKMYNTGSDEESGAKQLDSVDMTKDSATGVWSAIVNGDLVNQYYTYAVTTNEYGTKETPDVYGRTAGVNGDRSMVIDLDSTDPDGWDNDKRVDSPNQTDAVVWEVHIRDFSSDKNAGFSEKNRGKYLAFTEQGTKYSGTDISTGIDHLKELGVTHVQILPMFDYASLDERTSSDDAYNWGYDPKNYNVPEGSYSSNPYDGNARVKELKEMIQALHNAGIGVIMDVVYNHTYAPFGQNSSQTDFQKQQYSPLDVTVPGYYYTSTDWSGCGNSTDSTKAMYRKYMIDSMTYWANEYHLDGFRFDLMGIHDTTTISQIRQALNKIDPQIKLWGEPWCGDGSKNSLSGYGNKANIKNMDSNIAVFSDNMRDAIKGNTWDGKLSNAGYVTGNANRQTEVIAGIKAKCGDYDNINNNIWSNAPSQVITYTSCHDNHALYDILCMTMGYNQNGSRYDDIVNMNKVSASLVLTSQGISFMQAGEEFGRSKFGDHNSYKSSININQINWSNLKTFSDLNDYYTGLIKIRKNYSAFRDNTYTAADRINWLSTPSTSQIGYSLSNNVSGEWKNITCLFNVSTNDSTISLPSGNWVIIANDSKAGVESLGTASGSVTLKGRSSMILVDKDSFDSVTITDSAKVNIKYVDEDGNEIAKSTTKTGKVGTDYITEAKDIDDYVLTKTPSNAKGKFTEDDITVTYVYKADTTVKGTVTTKYIDLETNKTIKEDKVTKGAVDSKYTTSAEEINGYVLDDTYTPSNAKGTYTEGNIEVKYYYIASGTQQSDTLKIHYYNANSWKTPTVYIYNEGASASAKATEYSGAWPGKAMTDEGDGWWSYEVKDTNHALVIINDGTASGPKEPSGASTPGYDCTGEVKIKGGKVEEVTTTINKYVVRTKFVDSDTDKEIADSVASVYDADAKYTTKAIDIDGYELDEKPTNASGTISGKNIVVTYKYKASGDIPIAKGNVTIKYVDEDGNKLADSDTMTGNIGDKYTTSEKEIEGYVLVNTPANAEGTYTEDDITVYYVYQKEGDTPVKKGNVIVKYVNVENDEEIADSKTLTGIVGVEYSIEPITIDGYTLVSTPANAEGTYTEDDIQIIFGYKKVVDSGDDEVTTGKVIIKYIDSATGEEIRNSKTLEGKVGETYNVAKRAISGYTLLDMPENASGVYTKEDITVELKYKADSTTEEPGGNTDEPGDAEETSDSNPIAGLALLGLVSMIVGVKVKKER